MELQNNSHQETKKTLNSTVIKLGLVSFFADVASEMLYPITPIFLTTILGASMASLGFIEGTAEAIASLLKTYSGSWSDSISKRKPFIFIGYFFGAIAKPLIGVSHNWIGVLSARAIDRTGKGIRSAPRDALIADSVNPKQMGAAFGWHRAMDTFGAAVGPLLAIIFLNLNSNDLRSIYFWALIPGLLSVIVVLTVRESNQKTNQTQKTKHLNWSNPFHSWNSLSLPFKKFILAWGIFSFTNSSDVFLLMKAKNSGLSTTSVILVYCAYNLIYAFSSPWLGHLSDKIERKKILIGGLILFSFVYLGFGFATQVWQFWILFIIYGLYMGATDGVSKAHTVSLSNPSLKATNLGVLGTITGLCTIFASSIAGLIWDYFNSTSTFIFGATGAILASIILILTPNNK